jgi:hypothetical protein
LRYSGQLLAYARAIKKVGEGTPVERLSPIERGLLRTDEQLAAHLDAIEDGSTEINHERAMSERASAVFEADAQLRGVLAAASTSQPYPHMIRTGPSL